MKPSRAIRAIARRHGLDPEHPPEVLAEARALADRPGIDDPALVDRTDLPFVTIDEEHSRDLDQAVCVAPRAGGWRVWYAIADASWFVRPGAALFSEALARGASFYLPGLVVPMLPRILSEGVVSLNPGVDRRALLFAVDVDGDGRVRRTRIERARVRSRVKTWFDGRRLCPGGPDVAVSLRALREVGERRMALAELRDVVHFRRVELRVELPDGAEHFVATADLRNDVERWNEQISLMCNVEGGRLLAAAGQRAQPVFRTHEPPSAERLDRLQAQVDALIRLHGLDPARWRWRRGQQSLAAWLRSLPDDARGGRIARALHRQALLSTGRAAYTGEPGPHYGVGAEVYARFTAPMREIVGVFTHKECWEALGIEPDGTGDEALREAVIAASQRARDLQRDLDHEANRLVLDGLFGADLALPEGRRPRRPATVMGVSRSKLHGQLDDPPVDFKLYLAHLARQRGAEVFASRDGAVVRDRRTGDPVVRVGDAVRVWVRGRDAERDRWELGLQVSGPEG